MKTKYIKNIIGLAIIVIVAVFLFSRLEASWGEISKSVSLHPDVWSVFALFLFISAVMLSGILWGSVLNILTGKTSVTTREAVRVHIGAWLLKYIPGQVGSAVYKIAWAKDRGVSKRFAAWSFVYENLMLTIASIVPASLLLLAYGNLNRQLSQTILLSLVVFILLVANKRYLKKYLNILAAKFNVSKNIQTIESKQFFELVLEYIAPRVLNGLGFVLIANSLFGVGLHEVVPLIAAYTLAGIIGIYAIFVPSGLGVREAMIVLFVGGIFTIEQAALLAITTRFYATLADGLLAVIYSATSLSNKRAKAL